MRYTRTIITLGILTAAMPFLGFPGAWKSIFYFLFGFVIALLAYVNARPRVSGARAGREHANYEQNAPLEENTAVFAESSDVPMEEKKEQTERV